MDQKQIETAIEMGRQDALNVINNSTTGYSSLDNLIHYHALKKSGNPQILTHTYGSFTEARQNGEFEDYDIMEDPFMKKYTFLTK